MILRIHRTAGRIRARLPASIATVEDSPSAAAADPQTERWLRVELRAERLDWLPAVLASLDWPFIIEQPDALRGLITALAGLPAASRPHKPASPMTAAPEGRRPGANSGQATRAGHRDHRQ